MSEDNTFLEDTNAYKIGKIIAGLVKNIEQKLIGEFIKDWDFIYNKTYKYLYKLRQKELTDLDAIINMIYFYHSSRREKWEAKKNE